MKIYGDLKSGNCLKVKWVADLLGLPYAWMAIDIMKGETRTPEFLAMNVQGQVPVAAFPDGCTLAQSNAIIRYLGEGSRLLPADRFLRAKVDEWLFWEQYSHEPYIAVCRSHMLYRVQPKETREDWRVERGEAALDLMDRVLAERDWLVGDALSVADISLLAYTRVAAEGGFDLTERPHIREWITRCEGELDLTETI